MPNFSVNVLCVCVYGPPTAEQRRRLFYPACSHLTDVDASGTP